MTDGDTTFDLYEECLGIPPSEQPPDHYQLLGVVRFEGDVDVIAAAADRQTEGVASFTTGPHSAAAERLLAELKQARECLLNVVAKNAYDAGLRQSLTVSATKSLKSPASDLKSGRDIDQIPSVGPSISGTQNRPSPGLPNVGPGSGGMAQRMAGGRRRARKQQFVRLAGHVVFSAGGLAVAYFLLAKIGPQYDFLNLFEHPDNAPYTDNIPKELTDSLSGNQSIHQEDPKTTSSAGDSTRPTKTEVGQGVLPDANPHDPSSRRDAVVPSDTTSPIPVSPFAALPAEINLPTLGMGPMEIGPVDLSEGGDLGLRVIPPDKPNPTGKYFFSSNALTVQGGLKWNVFRGNDLARDATETNAIESDALGVPPVAEFSLRDGRLFMEWLLSAQELESPERLGNCLLAISLEGWTHYLQLRREVVVPPLAIDTKTSKGRLKACEVRIELPFLPNSANLFLKVVEPKGFPPMQCVTENLGKLEETRPLETHNVSWYFTGVDYAGLIVDWERSVQGVVIRAAPGYQLRSTGETRMILSLPDLDRREKVGLRNLKKIQNEHQVRVDRRPVLTRTQKNARAIRGSPGELQQHLTARRNKAIAEARTAIEQNEGRIKTLVDHIAKMEHDLNERIPRLKKLAEKIDLAQVHFRLYSLAGKREIVLCSNGRSASDEVTTPNADRSLGETLE